MNKLAILLLAASLLLTTACAGAAGGSSSGESSSGTDSSSSAASSGSSEVASVSSGASSGASLKFEPNPMNPAMDKIVQTEGASMRAAYEGTGAYANLPVAEIQTSMGSFKIRLFPDEAPKAVESFIKHAQDGYYEGVIFHRVMNDFMIQGGDPEGTGRGGESAFGGSFPDEFSPVLRHFRGAVSMANAGPNDNGSQFFVVQNKSLGGEATGEQLAQLAFQQQLMHAAESKLYETIDQMGSQDEMNAFVEQADAWMSAQYEQGMPEGYAKSFDEAAALYNEKGGTPNLDFKHTMFGYVFEGMDVVDKIAAVEVDVSNNDRPLTDVVIEKITIVQPQ